MRKVWVEAYSSLQLHISLWPQYRAAICAKPCTFKWSNEMGRIWFKSHLVHIFWLHSEILTAEQWRSRAVWGAGVKKTKKATASCVGAQRGNLEDTLPNFLTQRGTLEGTASRFIGHHCFLSFCLIHFSPICLHKPCCLRWHCALFTKVNKTRLMQMARAHCPQSFFWCLLF